MTDDMERWRGGVDVKLREIQADIKEIKSDVAATRARQMDNPYIAREEYNAKHEDLQRRVARNENALANLQGRGLIIAAVGSVFLAGLVSLLINHL